MKLNELFEIYIEDIVMSKQPTTVDSIKYRYNSAIRPIFGDQLLESISVKDIKKYQKAFISRLISAVLVFLVITIVQLLVNLLAGVEQESGEGEQTADIWDCSKKFINGVETSDTTTDEENTEESTQTE